MYPVLLEIGDFTINTYDVFWLFALLLAMFWTVRRIHLYKVDDREARRVIGWAFLAIRLEVHGIKAGEQATIIQRDSRVRKDLLLGYLIGKILYILVSNRSFL